MSTIIIPGGSTGFSLGSLVTTAVNIAILYFLFMFVRRNWNTVKNTFDGVLMADLSKFNLDIKLPKEEYTPKTSVDVFMDPTNTHKSG